MSNQPQPSRRPTRSGVLTVIVAIAIAAIYFFNVTGVSILGPTLGGPETPEAALTGTPAQEPAQEAAAVDSATAVPGEELPVEETATEVVEPTVAPTAIPASINGLPSILWEDLPLQAQDTIALIDEGGPFPFDRDGITFQNREGLLPQERNGYYEEYTVITPGESTRGARRIIAGAEGELYYTDDHYDSFSVVIREEPR